MTGSLAGEILGANGNRSKTDSVCHFWKKRQEKCEYITLEGHKT